MLLRNVCNTGLKDYTYLPIGALETQFKAAAKADKDTEELLGCLRQMALSLPKQQGWHQTCSVKWEGSTYLDLS